MLLIWTGTQIAYSLKSQEVPNKASFRLALVPIHNKIENHTIASKQVKTLNANPKYFPVIRNPPSRDMVRHLQETKYRIGSFLSPFCHNQKSVISDLEIRNQ